MSQPYIGQISMFGGNFAPRGWMLCAGQLLSISQYAALFSILGTTFGGNGTTTFVLPDFRHFSPGTHVESAGYAAELLDGALFAYVLMPGGSMFESPPVFGPPTAPAVAKRGNLLFVRNGFTFVVSTELSERVTEGSQWKATKEEENQILRKRLVDIVSKMQFVKPAPAK